MYSSASQTSAPQTTQPIRVMLVDDQRLVRGGLSMLVNSQPDLQVVMEADDGLAAIDVFDRMVSEGQAPQVILMDVRMPHCDGLEAARRILERDGEREVSEDERVRIIMLTTFDIDEYVYSAVRAGASGFLLKDTPPEQLLEAIRTVHRGDAVIAPSATRRLLEQMIPVLDSPHLLFLPLLPLSLLLLFPRLLVLSFLRRRLFRLSMQARLILLIRASLCRTIRIVS